MGFQGQEVGFIIKRFLPFKQKISIISRSAGKVALTVRDQTLCQRLWPGMLIAFEPQHWSGQIYIDQQAQVLAQFSPDTYESIRWINQLCEICYYFIPNASPTDEVYELLMKAFVIHEHRNSFDNHLDHIKLVIITDLFYLLGFYSDEDFFQLHSLCKNFTGTFAAETTMQEIDNIKNHLASQKESTYIRMKQWISLQIQKHPSYKTIKTMLY